jgi:hypothetical protein
MEPVRFIDPFEVPQPATSKSREIACAPPILLICPIKFCLSAEKALRISLGARDSLRPYGHSLAAGRPDRPQVKPL